MKYKKMNVGIVTIISDNYGNRLQNYALQQVLLHYGINVQTMPLNNITKVKIIKNIIKITLQPLLKRDKWQWDIFNFKNIKWSRYNCSNKEAIDKFDYFIAGSDQIWNPYFKFNSNREFLNFAQENQRIAYAASIGLDTLPKRYIEPFANKINHIPYISMREEAGADIVKQLTGKTVPVVLDPTMLLTRTEWKKIAKKSKYQSNQPYIFKYFLGDENTDYSIWLRNYADINGYKILELKDMRLNDGKIVGPSEFISLIENSTIVCTDSFHGTVFSILFERPFVTFERPDKDGFGKMSSRLDTLLKAFNFENRRVSSMNELRIIAERVSECNFAECECIIKKKREESIKFIKDALKIDFSN